MPLAGAAVSTMATTSRSASSGAHRIRPYDGTTAATMDSTGGGARSVCARAPHPNVEPKKSPAAETKAEAEAKTERGVSLYSTS